MAKKEVSTTRSPGRSCALGTFEVPRQRRRLIRAGPAARSRRRTGRRLPGGHDQPEFRDQGVQVRRGAAWPSPATCLSSAHRVGRPRVGPRASKEDVAPKVPITIAVGERSCRLCRHRAHASAVAMQHLLGRYRTRRPAPQVILGAAPTGRGAPTLAKPTRWRPKAIQKAKQPPVASNEPTPPSAGVAAWSRFSAHWKSQSAGDQGHRDPDHVLRPRDIPERGGAVICRSPHELPDWFPLGVAAYQRRPPNADSVIKSEMQEVKAVNFLIKHSGTIPVDRDGRGRWPTRLRGSAYERESSACIPRPRSAAASSSRSSSRAPHGWSRGRVPIVPLIVWGAQPDMAKDTKKTWGARRFRSPSRWSPIDATESIDETNAADAPKR